MMVEVEVDRVAVEGVDLLVDLAACLWKGVETFHQA